MLDAGWRGHTLNMLKRHPHRNLKIKIKIKKTKLLLQLSIPLKGTKTTAANHKKIRLYTFDFMADDFLWVTLLYPCFTRNLQKWHMVSFEAFVL